MTKDPSAEWQSGYEAGIRAAIHALEDDGELCDCAPQEDYECGCGALEGYKIISSERAVQIVRKLADTQ